LSKEFVVTAERLGIQFLDTSVGYEEVIDWFAQWLDWNIKEEDLKLRDLKDYRS
jgi:hypothetical protein